MDQMNLFDLFGSEFEEAVKTVTPKTEKTEKKAKKKATSKSTSKAKEIKAELPCVVRGSAFCVTIEGEGEVTAEKLLQLLVERGYEECGSDLVGVYIPLGNKKTAFIVPMSEAETDEDTDVALPVKFCFGMEKAELSAEEIPDEKVTLGVVAKTVHQLFPQYGDLPLSYDSAAAIVTFAVDEAKPVKALSYPLTIRIGDVVEKADGPLTVPELVKELQDEYDIPTGGLKLGWAGETVLACFSYGGAIAKGGKANTAPKKEKEAKFKLPATIRIVYAGLTEELTPEMFGGKESITKADLIDRYRETLGFFANEQKTAKMQIEYDDVTNTIVVMFASARLGAGTTLLGAIRSEGEYEQAVKEGHGFYPVSYGEYEGCKLFVNAVGTFLFDDAKLIKAELKEKIPYDLMAEITFYFNSRLPNEAVVEIRKDQNGFFVAYPETETATPISVLGTFATPEAGEEVVMNVHSHNVMDAFFSDVDDAAQVASIGFFGVVGHLNRPFLSTQFRACFNGMEAHLDLTDVFCL